jgi:hypothetical protein
MEKGVDFDDSFSPTPGLAVGRFMLSLAVANDYELHAFNHLLAAPTLMTEMLCTRFAALSMVTPLHHALCTRPWTPIF